MKAQSSTVEGSCHCTMRLKVLVAKWKDSELVGSVGVSTADTRTDSLRKAWTLERPEGDGQEEARPEAQTAVEQT